MPSSIVRRPGARTREEESPSDVAKDYRNVVLRDLEDNEFCQSGGTAPTGADPSPLQPRTLAPGRAVTDRPPGPTPGWPLRSGRRACRAPCSIRRRPGSRGGCWVRMARTGIQHRRRLGRMSVGPSRPCRRRPSVGRAASVTAGAGESVRRTCGRIARRAEPVGTKSSTQASIRKGGESDPGRRLAVDPADYAMGWPGAAGPGRPPAPAHAASRKEMEPSKDLGAANGQAHSAIKTDRSVDDPRHEDVGVLGESRRAQGLGLRGPLVLAPEPSGAR